MKTNNEILPVYADSICKKDGYIDSNGNFNKADERYREWFDSRSAPLPLVDFGFGLNYDMSVDVGNYMLKNGYDDVAYIKEKGKIKFVRKGAQTMFKINKFIMKHCSDAVIKFRLDLKLSVDVTVKITNNFTIYDEIKSCVNQNARFWGDLGVKIAVGYYNGNAVSRVLIREQTKEIVGLVYGNGSKYQNGLKDKLLSMGYTDPTKIKVSRIKINRKYGEVYLDKPLEEENGKLTMIGMI